MASYANFLEGLPEVLKAASASPLAIFALILILIALLAYHFFHSSRKTSIRMAAYVLATICFMSIAYLTWAPGKADQQSTSKIEVVPQSKQETHGDQSPAIGEMKNSSINYGIQQNHRAGGQK